MGRQGARQHGQVTGVDPTTGTVGEHERAAHRSATAYDHARGAVLGLDESFLRHLVPVRGSARWAR